MALDFFAGSGLATCGLSGQFAVKWANDICPKKAATYNANHADHPIFPRSITEIRGQELPAASLAWASFPCQDLSLAGNMLGLGATRSGLVREWLRIIGEMTQQPAILVAENVPGFLTAAQGVHYQAVHQAIESLGYRAGAIVLDASDWLPQSRPRVFLVAVRQEIDVADFTLDQPGWGHSESIKRTASALKRFVWWSVKRPNCQRSSLRDVIDWDHPVDDAARSRANIALIPKSHRERLGRACSGQREVFAGYKRTRNGKQCLELRFDGVAGCLRTPGGGSSRQLLILSRDRELRTRLLTVTEAARLMGAPDGYRVVGTYNEGYKAMGDAVAVPVVQHLAACLLSRIAERASQ